MRTPLTFAILLAAVPFLGGAQELPGIDLNQPPKAEKAQAPGEGELPPIDLSQSQPAQPQAGKAEEPAATGVPFSESDVALGDKVKAVQRKGFIKRHRFEIEPQFSLSINDPFFQKFGGGLKIAYNFADTFALAVRGTYLKSVRTDAVREGKLAYQSQLLASQASQLLMLDGVWAPIYGKASFLNKNIVHFDLYLQAGFGLAWSATSVAPRNEGPHLATDLGGGVRFYPKQWLAFDLGLNATLYPDQPEKSVPGTVQKIFVANIGFSFFFPTTFEYQYP
jgi:outer membrane beta-barrel protein